MSRPDRWWRPPTARRPAQRARQRRMYSGKELDTTFDLGYTIGQADEEKRARRRDDLLHRLADASEAASNGDPGPMDELAREVGLRPADDLLDVADAAGVTPLVEDALRTAEGIGDAVEQWLRDREGDG